MQTVHGKRKKQNKIKKNTLKQKIEMIKKKINGPNKPKLKVRSINDNDSNSHS